MRLKSRRILRIDERLSSPTMGRRPFLICDNEGDSNSIAHQIDILIRYAKDYGITSYKIYKDDGYSGTNFNRPGFQEMLADIEDGNVSMVVVKDMSWFGCNYLEVGMDTEIMFPDKDVRFIAVNDGVDSDREDKSIRKKRAKK